MVSVLLIWALTGVLCYEAVLRIKDPEDIDPKIMFGTALGGVLINLLYGAIRNGVCSGSSFI